MATTQSGKKAASRKSARSRTEQQAAAGTDALTLLESQHREVRGWLQQHEEAGGGARKLELVQKICTALKAHTQIEEEIFYPEARRATGEEDLLDEAVVEHQAAKQLIGEVEAMQPGDDLYDAKVKVLGEEVAHHVKEEQDELFPLCRESDMDLEGLGRQMAARFAELVAELAARTPRLH